MRLLFPTRRALLVLAVTVGTQLVLSSPASAQLDKLRSLAKGKEVFDKVRPMSVEEERALGESVGHRLKSNMGVVDDAAMQRYVNLVGRTVARHMELREEFPPRFIVLDADHINAFSVPGGDIYVTRGLVETVTSEAQLAGVLGHELTHSINRHAAKAVEKSDRWGAVGDVALENKGELFNRLTDAATSTVLVGYGREEERECDQGGLAGAAAAGYQAQGLAEFLAILEADSRRAGNLNRGGLLGSHPEVGARIEAVRKQIAADGLGGGARLADRYHTAVPNAAQDRTLDTLLAANASLAPGQEQQDEPKRKKKLGFGKLKKLAGFGKDNQASSDDRSTSAAVRGVGETELGEGAVAYTDPVVEITAQQLAAFIDEGGLKT